MSDESDVEISKGRRKPTGQRAAGGTNVGAGAFMDIAYGRILTGFYSADADVTDVVVEVLVGVAWEPVNSSEGTPIVGVANAIVATPRLVSDGASLRLRNTGAGSVDPLWYIYEV